MPETQSDDTIQTEDCVPNYSLPDPLLGVDGNPIISALDWPNRRKDILSLFEQQMYGQIPEQEVTLNHRLQSEDREALGGKATRKEITILASQGDASISSSLLVYLPNQVTHPAPVFLGLNFFGNHAIQHDPGIHLSTSWMPDFGIPGIVDHRATDAVRGIEATRWPVERILSRGYGLATMYCGDMDPDFDDGFQNGVHPLFYAPGQNRPYPFEWGTISAWAWGLSRALDALQSDPQVDGRRVAVMGHSRLGKTALWAGARDQRFGLVISNNSGCGGAALSRRKFGETVRLMNDRFPHWLCENNKKYNDREAELPFDQHMLVALVAPRPVYIASAVEDLWSDPRGEFLSGLAASPVYKLLGKDGLAIQELPKLEQPVMSTIGYHIRRGKHDVTIYDWDCFMDFADRQMV